MTLHDLDTKFHEIQNDHFYACCLFDREQADRKLMRAIILVKNMAENELRYIPDMTDDQKNMLQLLTKALKSSRSALEDFMVERCVRKEKR